MGSEQQHPDPQWVAEYVAQQDSPILSRLRDILARKQAVVPARQHAPPAGHGTTAAPFPLPTLPTTQPTSASSDHGEWSTDASKSLRWRGSIVLHVRGAKVVAPYSFGERVIDACWAYIPDLPSSTSSNSGDSVLCVLFRHRLYIALPTWGADPIEVPLAFAAADMWPAHQGMFIKRLPEAEDYTLPTPGAETSERLPTLFYFAKPLQEIRPVYMSNLISRPSVLNDTASAEPTTLYQEPLHVFDSLGQTPIAAVAHGDATVLVMRGEGTDEVNVFSYSVGSTNAVALTSRIPTIIETLAMPRGRPSIPSTMGKGRISSAMRVEGDALDRTQRSSWMTPASSARPEEEMESTGLEYPSSLRPRNASGMARTSSMGRSSGMGRSSSLIGRSASGMARTPSMMRTSSSSSSHGVPQTPGPGSEAGLQPDSAPRNPWSDLDDLDPGHALVSLLEQLSIPAGMDISVRLAPPRRPEESATLVLVIGGQQHVARSLVWSSHPALPEDGQRLTLETAEVPSLTTFKPRCTLTSSALQVLDAVLDTSSLRQAISQALNTPSTQTMGARLNQDPFVSLEWEAFCTACFGNIVPPSTGMDTVPAPSIPGLSINQAQLLARIDRGNAHIAIPLAAYAQGIGSHSFATPDTPTAITAVMPTPEDTRALAALHILAQELMLDMRLRQMSVKPLAKLLVQLAKQCGARPLAEYWLTWLGQVGETGPPGPEHATPHLDWFDFLVSRKRVCSEADGDAFASFCLGLGLDQEVATNLRKVCWRMAWTADLDQQHKALASSSEGNAHERWLTHCSAQLDRLAEQNVTPTDVALLVPAIHVDTVLRACHDSPWLLRSRAALELVGRMDCAAQLAVDQGSPTESELVFYEQDVRTLPSFSHHGSTIFLPPICGQLFPEDFRLQEACSMLDTSRPQFMRVSNKLIEEDTNRYVLGGLSRIQATTVGRGMLTLRSKPWVPTRNWSTSPLVLEVRVSKQKWATPAVKDAFEMEWVDFHNGVSSALSLINDQKGGIDSHWLFCTQGPEPNATHAGFILGVGLLGQLGGLGRVHAWRYLVHRHSLTSVGVILGLAATFVGTQDQTAFTLTSIQLPSFLPPDSAPLNTPFATQAAGLLSVGLLFMASDQRSKVEVLLRDLIPPEPESPHLQTDYREGHALAAGFSLGLIMLGRARREPLQSQADWKIIQTLQDLMDGSPVQHLRSTQRSASNKLDYVGLRNTERLHRMSVSSAPATIAIAFIFLRSGRADVANRMTLPQSMAQMDDIRPDLLFSRVLARSLIMWDEIRDDEMWMSQSLPRFLHDYHLRRPSPDGVEYNPQEEAPQLGFINMRMGAAFAMGLRFAGKGRMCIANETLSHELHMFRTAAQQPLGGYFSKIRYNLLQAAMDVVGLALAMVLAGTGDVNLMRFLRERHHCLDLTYGNQMATHMALGMLFLGGGRFTFARSDQAISSLVISCWPRFPSSRTDNRAHLQAFRHLWVLALDQRLLLARDVDTGHSESIRILADEAEGSDAPDAPDAPDGIDPLTMMTRGRAESGPYGVSARPIKYTQVPFPLPRINSWIMRPGSPHQVYPVEFDPSNKPNNPFAGFISPAQLPSVDAEYTLYSSTSGFWPSRLTIPEPRGTAQAHSHPLVPSTKLNPILWHLKRTVQVQWRLPDGHEIIRPLPGSDDEPVSNLATATSVSLAPHRPTQPESQGRFVPVSPTEPGARAWLLGLLATPPSSTLKDAQAAAGIYQMVNHAAYTGNEARLASQLFLAGASLDARARSCFRPITNVSWPGPGTWGARDASVALALTAPSSDTNQFLVQVVQAAQNAQVLHEPAAPSEARNRAVLQASAYVGLPLENMTDENQEQAALLIDALARAQELGL